MEALQHHVFASIDVADIDEADERAHEVEEKREVLLPLLQPSRVFRIDSSSLSMRKRKAGGVRKTSRRVGQQGCLVRRCMTRKTPLGG